MVCFPANNPYQGSGDKIDEEKYAVSYFPVKIKKSQTEKITGYGIIKEMGNIGMNERSSDYTDESSQFQRINAKATKLVSRPNSINFMNQIRNKKKPGKTRL